MAKKKQQDTVKTEPAPEYTNVQIDLKGLTDVQITTLEVLLFEGRLREREEILAELKAVLPATMESAYWAGLMQALTIVQNRHSSRTSDESAPASE
jgi:hypothetical protein